MSQINYGKFRFFLKRESVIKIDLEWKIINYNFINI